MELRDILTITREGSEEPIRTETNWQEKREQIRRGFLEIAGAFPAEQVALNTEWLEAFDCGPYVRHKVRYLVEPDDRVPAYLLVPKKEGRMPAVLALHGSAGQSQNWGKDWPAGIPLDLQKYADTKIGVDRMETHYMPAAYGHQLACRGFVALCPDQLNTGERYTSGPLPMDTTAFYEKHPDWSATGKAIWDTGRGIDFLETLDFVDAERIGAIGFSLGGHHALCVAAWDERVKAAVCACGMNTLAENPEALEWARAEDKWYTYFKKLRPILLEHKPLPVDFHELAALIAPRAFLNIWSGRDRTLNPNPQAMARAMEMIAGVYNLLEQPEAFAGYVHNSGHSFRDEALALAFAWLERFLKPAYAPSRG
jgi:dienelactone hydrolase